MEKRIDDLGSDHDRLDCSGGGDGRDQSVLGFARIILKLSDDGHIDRESIGILFSGRDIPGRFRRVRIFSSRCSRWFLW